MSDVAEAPTQDQIAESLLGEPQEQQAEQPVTEQPVEQEQAQSVEQLDEQEAPQEEVENWLPTEQDKIFPDEVLSRYAQRYGLDENLLANPQLKQMLIDKINSDIWIEQQQNAQQFEEPETVQEPTQDEPQLTREQYFANLDQVIAQRTDPQVAKDFYTGFMKVFGVPDAEIAKGMNQALPFTQLMSKYALNLINSFLPDMFASQLQSQLTQAFPGFGEMYERSSYAMSWDRVRNSNPAFAALPSYGTKEFSKVLREASARVPGFDEMQFTDSTGKPLGMMENAQRKYTMLAQIASGQNVDPQLLQRAATAQARNQRRAEVRRSNANLGSGQSKAASGNQPGNTRFQTNSDLFDEETMDQFERDTGRL